MKMKVQEAWDKQYQAIKQIGVTVLVETKIYRRGRDDVKPLLVYHSPPIPANVLDLDTVEKNAFDAARNLALTVLDKAFTYDAKHRHTDVSDGCCQYHDLRSQVEQLGTLTLKRALTAGGR